tara:strand:- start:6785 stop:7084 length:300 start_codon:yes stop_codon:yes gene_type:complete
MIFTISEKQGPHGLLLVITDTDILGKKFVEDKKQLDLTVEFYQGEEKSKEEIYKLLEKARDIHATGKHSVGLLVEKEIVDPNNIIYIQGIPHAQVVVGD